MKAYNKIFLSLGLGAMALGMGSCVGDLDLLPTDPNSQTSVSFKNDVEKAMDGMIAGVYQQYVTYGANGNASVQGFDGGMSTFQRAIFIMNECTTDEANWIAADADYGQLQYGIIPSNNRVDMGVYSRMMINQSVCNNFIQTFRNPEETIGVSYDQRLREKCDEYMRQCRILRAAAYYYAADIFGNVPYVNDNDEIGGVPAQLDRSEGMRLTAETLEGIVAEYNAMGNPTPAYGYVGVDVAEALLVKIYLNYEVYTGNAAWDKCLAHCENIIKRHQGNGFKSSGLAKNYSALFGANNEQFCTGGGAPNEILWTLPQDIPNITSYANSTFMVNAWIGESDPKTDTWKAKKSDWNTNDAWKCITARPEFVQKFEWTDDDMSVTADDRVRFWKTSADGFTFNNLVYDQDHYGDNGYLAVKYSNWAFTPDGNLLPADQQPAATNQLGADYAMIRLAEIYLSAAEAILHGAGDKAKAVEYVNYIRERANLAPWTASKLDLESLQDERCRELYTEGTRRTDLIRYGKWISGYNWAWKNNVLTGTDFPSYYNVYPLPSQFVFDAGYKQNPGY